MKRVRDAGAVTWGVGSGHRAISLRLDIGEAQRHYLEKPPMRADRTLLQDPEKTKEWQEAVRKHVALLTGTSVDGVTATKLQVLEAAMQAAAKDVLMVDGRRRPDRFLAAKRSLEPVIADRNRLMVALWRTQVALRRKMRRAVHAKQCDRRWKLPDLLGSAAFFRR